MTTIKETPLLRETADALGPNFGRDRNRRLVVGLLRVGHADMIEFRPKGTRQRILLRLADVFRYALWSQSNLKQLEKARARKAAKAQRLADQRQKRAEKRLFK